MKYFHRGLEAMLLQSLQQFPATLVTGPRQAGKSTLLKHCLKGYSYVSLDDPPTRALAADDPELFLSTHPEPLIIDEIQHVTTLLSYLKVRIDHKRDTYGRYVLTGSQSLPHMRGVAETLAGRIALFDLLPFSACAMTPFLLRAKFRLSTGARMS